MRSGNLWLCLGAVAGLLGVAAGAFGAHVLENSLSSDALVTHGLAARYQIYHALALLAVAWRAEQASSLAIRISGASFVFGIVVFSGSLYALSWSGVRTWGALTPVGGVALMVVVGEKFAKPMEPEQLRRITRWILPLVALSILIQMFRYWS